MIVFDLDHTLLKVNSSFYFGRYLFQQKFFRYLALFESLCDYARHKWFGMPIQDLHESSFSRLFQGRSKEDVCLHAETFLSKHLDSILNEKILLRLKEAQKAGKHILILSSSPDFLVEAIAQRLSVAMSRATHYDTDSQGNFIRISRVMAGREKAEYVSELAKTLSLSLSCVTAYSDSVLDLPLLKLVGEAIGVNPDNQLKRICLQQGWKIEK